MVRTSTIVLQQQLEPGNDRHRSNNSHWVTKETDLPWRVVSLKTARCLEKRVEGSAYGAFQSGLITRPCHASSVASKV
jgi:hypothetical protein